MTLTRTKLAAPLRVITDAQLAVREEVRALFVDTIDDLEEVFGTFCYRNDGLEPIAFYDDEQLRDLGISDHMRDLLIEDLARKVHEQDLHGHVFSTNNGAEYVNTVGQVIDFVLNTD